MILAGSGPSLLPWVEEHGAPVNIAVQGAAKILKGANHQFFCAYFGDAESTMYEPYVVGLPLVVSMRFMVKNPDWCWQNWKNRHGALSVDTCNRDGVRGGGGWAANYILNHYPDREVHLIGVDLTDEYAIHRTGWELLAKRFPGRIFELPGNQMGMFPCSA